MCLRDEWFHYEDAISTSPVPPIGGHEDPVVPENQPPKASRERTENTRYILERQSSKN